MKRTVGCKEVEFFRERFREGIFLNVGFVYYHSVSKYSEQLGRNDQNQYRLIGSFLRTLDNGEEFSYLVTKFTLE